MALSMRVSARTPLGCSRLPARPVARTPMRLVCQAQPKEQERTLVQKLSLPIAGMMAAMMLGSSMVMPEAAEAARSGGRAGGGFSSGRMSSGRSAAPSRAAPAPQTESRTYSSYNTYVAPPVVVPGGGYGYSPFGYGGGFSSFSIVPFGFFGGGIIQFFFLMLAISVVFNVISGVASKVSQGKDSGSGRKGGDKDGDGWGDL